jgi:anaerobic selenocysteine-containing dehydrogenase
VVDWMDDYERPNAEHPLKLVTPPARHFLNTSFTETETSVAKEGGNGPVVRIHPGTAAAHGVAEGALVRLGNRRGKTVLRATLDAGQRPGTLVVEGLWPESSFVGGAGINVLTPEAPVPPNGGVGFHDIAVWLEPVTA